MTSKNNPEATTQPPAEETAAVAPAADATPPAEAAPEGNPPVVDGIIRLRDANGALYDYSINSFDAASAREVYTLLPPMWQQKIDAQAAFFQNYQRTITDIPEELRAPGALEKLLKQIHQQGGYLSEETSPAVRAWLDGPDTAGLRSSGLFKGYKAASTLADIASGVGNFLGDLPSAYYDGLLLPVRGLLYAGNVATTELTKMAAITPEQAKSMATAYQGMMYMATESEFAPKETKTEAPGTVSTVGGFIQSAFNNTAVFGFALWNMVSGWLSGEDVTWEKAWKDAEDYWTEGKGLQSGSEAAQTIAVGASLDEARPIVEEQLRSATIDGVEMAPYLGLEKGSLYTGPDDNVYTYNGPDEAPTPVLGPDGETPLKASEIEKDNLQSVPGGLFQDLSPSGVAASVAGGVIAPALTYKGVAEGYARTKILGEKPGVEKAHAAAKVKLETAKDAYRTFKTAAENGELKNLRGQPLSKEKINAKGQKLWDARVKAYNAFEELDVKLNGLPEDPIADAKQSSSWGQRQLGKFAEAGVKQLPENADIGDKIIHRLKAFGRWPGAAAAHVSGWIPNFSRGLASGAADAISPDERGPSVKPFFGDKAKEGAKAIRELGEVEPTTKMGGFGKFVGKWGTGLAAVGTFASPVVGFSTSEDTAGAATYAASGAGLAGATFVAGGKKFGLKALGVGVRRIVPGAGLVMDGVDYMDGSRTGNEQKKRDAVVSASTQAIGGMIGGAIGAVGFVGGPLGVATTAGGAALGTTIGGLLSMATVPASNYFWPVKAESKPAPTTATQPAAPAGALKASTIKQAYNQAVSDFDANGTGSLSNQEIEAALEYVGYTHKSQVDTNNDGKYSKLEFLTAIGYLKAPAAQVVAVGNAIPSDDVTRFRMAVNSIPTGGALPANGGGQRPPVVRLQV